MEISNNKIFKWIFQFWQNCIFSILPLCTYISQIECKQYFLSTICYRVHHISLKKMNFYHFFCQGLHLHLDFQYSLRQNCHQHVHLCDFQITYCPLRHCDLVCTAISTQQHFQCTSLSCFCFVRFFFFFFFLSHMTGWLKMSRTADMSWRIF